MKAAVLAALIAVPLGVQERVARPLTEPELIKVLPNSVMEEIIPYELRAKGTSERFSRYGSYALHGPNVTVEGRYTIQGDRFCTHVAGKEKACRYLLLDPRGYYWVSKTKSPNDFRLVSITALPKQPEIGPYAGRNGAAEARSDIGKRRPLKLYTYSANGEFPGFLTPGLFGCDPDRNNGSKAADALFEQLIGVELHEDRITTEEQSILNGIASKFAESYNLEVFRRRKAEILKLCPRAQLDRDG